MTRRRLILVSAVAAVLIGALLFAAFGRTALSRDAAGIAKVTREEFTNILQATGALEAAVSNQLGPPSIPDVWSYNLTSVVPEGSVVKTGDVLTRYDATEIEDHLRASQADFETAVKEREKEEKNLEVDLEQLDLSLVDAKAQLERASLEAAVPDDLLSSLEAREAKLKEQVCSDKVELLQQKVRSRREQVAAQLKLLEVKRQRAEQRIAYYKNALERFAVKSPSDGVIVYVRKRDGSRWEVGESVWMLAKVVEVADLSTLRVSAQLLEVDAGRVKAGRPASVTVDAIPGRVWKSRVAEVGKLVRPRSQQDPGKVFDVYIPLGEIDRKTMRPGMSVRVEIEEARIPGALTIPIVAVREKDGAPAVLVEGANGVEERAVRLGPRNRDRIVVLEGLTEGERVKTS